MDLLIRALAFYGGLIILAFIGAYSIDRVVSVKANIVVFTILAVVGFLYGWFVGDFLFGGN